MITLFLIIFSTLSFATESTCEDDIDRFLQVTKLETITCEAAYYELHERCEQKIPTAPSYKLEEFCCAFCANLPDSTSTTTTTTSTTSTTTTTATITSSDESSSGDTYEPTYKPTASSGSGYATYSPTYAPTATGYSSSTSTSNDDDDNALILGVTITTILAVLFLVGWVILYFQLDKRGYWTKGIIKPEKLGSDSESEGESYTSSESSSSNASLYERGNGSHEHLLHRQPHAGQQHRVPHGPPPMFPMPFQPVPPMQGFNHGMVPGPMGFIPPPMQPPAPPPGDHYSKPNHHPTASYSHGPFTNASVHDFDDDSNRYFSLANHLILPSDSETTHTTFSGSTTTTRTDNHTTDSDAGKAETPHKRQESLDPMKLVVDMQRQLENHQSENTLNTILDSPHHETKSMGSTDSHSDKHDVMKKEDEIHIVIETTGRDDEAVKRDVHVL